MKSCIYTGTPFDKNMLLGSAVEEAMIHFDFPPKAVQYCNQNVMERAKIARYCFSYTLFLTHFFLLENTHVGTAECCCKFTANIENIHQNTFGIITSVTSLRCMRPPAMKNAAKSRTVRQEVKLYNVWETACLHMGDNARCRRPPI